MSGPFDTTTLPGWFNLLGIVVFIVGIALIAALKGRGVRVLWTIPTAGFVLVVIGLATIQFAPPAAVAPAAPSSAAISVAIGTSPALPTGCTSYTAQYQTTCLVEFNKTSTAFCFVSAVATTNACKAGTNYINLPFKMIRTDNGQGPNNATFGFTSALTSISTANSLGSSPQTYSLVGYTAATSASPGVWQVFPDKGTLASQKPTVTAPTVSTNLESTVIPIATFQSASVGWHVSLAGSNSTSAPTLFAEALTNFTAYPFVFSFSNAGIYATYTLFLTPVAWTT